MLIEKNLLRRSWLFGKINSHFNLTRHHQIASKHIHISLFAISAGRLLLLFGVRPPFLLGIQLLVMTEMDEVKCIAEELADEVADRRTANRSAKGSHRILRIAVHLWIVSIG